MSSKIELEFGDIHSTAQSSEAVSLIMKEKNGNRYVPIIIGINEARAILLEINKVKTNRPITHELFATLSIMLNCDIVEVDIIHYDNGIYFADLLLKKDNGALIHLDARPSDAIALALHFYAPIFMNQNVFEETCMTENPAHAEDDEGIMTGAELHFTIPQGETENDIVSDPYIDRKLTEMSSGELRKLLEGAVESEDYELAAKIQEELNRREA